MLSCPCLLWMPAFPLLYGVWLVAPVPASLPDPSISPAPLTSPPPPRLCPRPRPARSIFQSADLSLFSPNFPYCSGARLALPPTHVAYRPPFSSALVPRGVTCTVTVTATCSDLVIISDSYGVTLVLDPPLVPAFFSDPNFRTISRPATALLRIHPLTVPARLSAPLFGIAGIVLTTTTSVASPSPPIHRDRHRPLFIATIDDLTRLRPLCLFNTQQKDGSYQADSPKVHGW